MAQYQNLFTSVQPVGPLHHGVDLPRGDEKRLGTPFLFHLLGRIGNAQIGPVYLGTLGVASLIFGIAAFNIIGRKKPQTRNSQIAAANAQATWVPRPSCRARR